MRVARPIARGRQRRRCLFGALSTNAVSTNKVSTSTLGLCVLALATALSISFLTIGAADLRVNSSNCRASPAPRPRTRSTMTRALRGLIRVNRAIALLTMVGASWLPSYPLTSSQLLACAGRYGSRKRLRKGYGCAPRTYGDAYFTHGTSFRKRKQWYSRGFLRLV